MTTIARTMTILCPDYCRQDEYQGHEPSIDDSGQLFVNHQGPDFGHLYGNREQVEDVVTSEVIAADIERRSMSAVELRQLAADALAAVEWLEAQTRRDALGPLKAWGILTSRP